MPSYDGHPRHRPRTEHEDFLWDESTPARAPFTRVQTRADPLLRRHARPMTTSPPIPDKLSKQDAPKPVQPEVRFTFPREQLVSDDADPTKAAPSTPAKPDTPLTKTDNQLQIVRQRLERLRKRKEEAEKARDITTAADLTYYAIPELEADLEKLLLQQLEEGENSAAPVSQNEEDKSHQAEVETENEGSEDLV